jgi:hypothetical protein
MADDAEKRKGQQQAEQDQQQRNGKGNGSRRRAPGARFYDRVLTREEIELVAGMAASPSLNDEIALLKVLIRRKLEEGSDLATISKAVDALARALKVQKQISDEGQRALQDALVAVLAELGEQGAPLGSAPLRSAGQAGSREQRAGSKKKAKDVVVR